MAKLLKVTYHGGPKKLSAYLRNPSQVLAYLYREIELRFQNKQLPQLETIRTFWIDADGDEIEIIDQNDYETFREKCESTKTDMHLQLAPTVSEPTVAQKEAKTSQEGAATAAANDTDASNFIIHDNVECDGCGLAPLVGFRYKCVQCPNFDLCQRCEAAHKHPEHLMVRMPSNNGPSVVDAWLTGPEHGSCHRRFKGRSKGHCPFGEAAAAAAAAAPQTATGPSSSHKESRESRRERRHARRHGGVLSQFMEMMMNMPESNVEATSAATAAATAAPKSSSKEPSAPEPIVEAKTAEKVTATAAPTKEGNSTTTETATEAPKEATPEPVAAPRAKEPAQANSTASTPTTPVINLDNLSQIVPPEYMRAGIEILNNFSEMFAKMLDPADVGVELGRRNSTVSMTSATSAASAASTNTDSDTTPLLNTNPEKSKEASLEQPIKAPVAESQPLLAEPVTVAKPESTVEQRSRSESLDQLDWQLVDGNVTTASPEPEALINLEASTEAPKAATTPVGPAGPVPNFSQLGELLRQHVNEEQQREQASTQTQTAQVDTVSTSTSTTSIATNGNDTATPAKPEEKRSLPIYHTDEKINSAIHAMMAMGFSNEGAWLTQLLESVDGNIAVALDIMHTSQSNRQ